MTYPTDSQLEIRSWAFSALFHSAVVGGALFFAAHVQIVPPKEPFTWNVSLVAEEVKETVATPAVPAQPQRAAPLQKVTQPPESVSQVITHQVQRIESQTVMQRVQPHVVEQAKAVVENSGVVQREEAKQEQLQSRHAAVAEQRLVNERLEAVERREEDGLQKAVHESSVQEVTHAEVAQREAVAMPAQNTVSQSAAVTTQQASETAVVQREVRESAVVQSPGEPIREEAVIAMETAATAVVSSHHDKPAGTSAPTESIPSELPPQVAKAVPSTSHAKADHLWLAESLWRRVAELKRYPTSARLHGLEGKVVLKAVIRSDGHLAEVSVQKSSGHTVLDEAAMEAVKLACPLHMKHQLETPQIVLNLPIVYSLAN